jgi:hypothetical protein
VDVEEYLTSLDTTVLGPFTPGAIGIIPPITIEEVQAKLEQQQ